MDRRKRARLDLNEEGGANVGMLLQSGDGVLHCQNVDCTNLMELAESYKTMLNVRGRMLTTPTFEGDSVLTPPVINVASLMKLWTKRCTRGCARGSLNAFVHACATYPSPDMLHHLITTLKGDASLSDLIMERNADGGTLLHLSVNSMEVKEETIKLLMSKIGINDVDNKGDNVLSYAVQGGRSEAYLKLLLRLGAEPGISNDGSSLALQAVKAGNIDAFKLFWTISDMHLEATEGTLLHKVLFEYASNLPQQAIHETVKVLLSISKDLAELGDDEGRTALWFAKNGSFKDKVSAETVQLLLDCKKEQLCKLIQNFPEPQPHFPVMEGNVNFECEAETAKEDLQELTSSTQARCLSNVTPPPSKVPQRRSSRIPSLKYKQLDDDEKMRKLFRIVSNTTQCQKDELEEKKAELKLILTTNPGLVNRGMKDVPPLLYKRVHVDLLKFLIQEGADVTATAKWTKETVLHRAPTRHVDAEGYHQLVQEVEKRNPSVLGQPDYKQRLALHNAVMWMELKKETLNIFKNCKVDLSAKDHKGWNLFTFSLFGRRSIEFLKSLLEFGVKPVRDNDGITMVHAGAMKPPLEIMKFIIDLSPEDVMALDNNNQSPLHYAIRSQNLDQENVRKTRALLNDYNVKDHLKADHMRNLIRVAVQKSNEASAECIERKKEIIDEIIKLDDSLLREERYYNQIPLECENVHPELIKYLIEKGSDPRHRRDEGSENFNARNESRVS